MNRFSPSRLWAVVVKEFVQMRRDRLTFAMMIGIPLMQMIIFGFAINADPRHLPLAVLSADNSPFSRSIVAAMQNTNYFDLVRTVSERRGSQAAHRPRRGPVRALHPGRLRPRHHPRAAAGPGPGSRRHRSCGHEQRVSALRVLADSALRHDLKGPLAFLQPENRNL
jgi:ABC-2 type transport system permease protein